VKTTKIKKAIDILRENKRVEVPYHVWTTFGEGCKEIIFSSKEASLGLDFKSEEQIKKSLEWYVNQFGGTVEWTK
jgi:hypothetical protein